MNFFPRGQSEIVPDETGKVKSLVGDFGGKKFLLNVQNSKINRTSASHIPWFDIPEGIRQEIYAQAYAICLSHARTAQKFLAVKKPNWTKDFRRYGLILDLKGGLKITRWIVTDGKKHQILMKVHDIHTAIRMQDNIITGYQENKEILEAEPVKNWQFHVFFKKLPIVLPFIEMRKELLASARSQMLQSMSEAAEKVKVLLAKEVLTKDDISQIIFYLTNNWFSPYREKINLIIALLKQAKNRCNKTGIDPRDFLKNVLWRLSTSIDLPNLIRLGLIDPIYTLSQVDKLGKTDQILELVKNQLPAACRLKRNGLYRLAAFLIMSKLVLNGQPITENNICHSCEQQNLCQNNQPLKLI